MIASLHCPLCDAQSTVPFFRDSRREYLRCAVCALVFVPHPYHLDAARERAEYDLHENHVDDPGYRRFLSRLADPLLARLPAAACGLDFGCGPGPALAAMLAESGHDIALYDPFYFPDTSALNARYTFITATEVVEHLSRPGMELNRLWGMLEPEGYLAIMTKRVTSAAAFANWHYKNDPTHICFFSEATLRWWAETAQAKLELIGADVALLQKA